MNIICKILQATTAMTDVIFFFFGATRGKIQLWINVDVCIHTNIIDRLSDALNENPLFCNIFTSQGRSTSFTPRKVENTSSARTTKYDKCCESSTRWLLHGGFKKCEGRENECLDHSTCIHRMTMQNS